MKGTPKQARLTPRTDALACPTDFLAKRGLGRETIPHAVAGTWPLIGPQECLTLLEKTLRGQRTGAGRTRRP